MFTVFVLGNIASGKSTACRYLESHGAMLIDLDELAKSLYVPGSDIVNTLAEEFGWDILDEEGGVRRNILAHGSSRRGFRHGLEPGCRETIIKEIHTV